MTKTYDTHSRTQIHQLMHTYADTDTHTHTRARARAHYTHTQIHEYTIAVTNGDVSEANSSQCSRDRL